MKGELKDSEERLKKAKTLLVEENYPESLRISKETSEVLNRQQQKIVSDLASSIIESIQKAKGKGMDVSELNDKIRRANSAIGKKDYLDAYRIMTKSKEETLSEPSIGGYNAQARRTSTLTFAAATRPM